MENFYDRVNKYREGNDLKPNNEFIMNLDEVKGEFYGWMEDVLLKLDELKNNGHNSETIDKVKEIINSKCINL